MRYVLLLFLPVIGYDLKGPPYGPYVLPCGTTGSDLNASAQEVKDGGYFTLEDSKPSKGCVLYS